MSTSLSGATGYKSGVGKSTGLKGSGYVSGAIQQFTPEQMGLFKQMFGQVGGDSYLGKLAAGDQSQFEQLERPAMKQFGALQGNLASRFSGQGLGARNSSGFQNTSNQATQDFASQLQSQRMGIQQQAIQSLFGMQNQLLGQRPYETFVGPKQLSYGQQLGIAGAGALGQIAGGAASGATGAIPWAKIFGV